MQDRDTQRVYRLYDFTKAQHISPDQAHCIAGRANSADRLYLVIESVGSLNRPPAAPRLIPARPELFTGTGRKTDRKLPPVNLIQFAERKHNCLAREQIADR
jgi:hypothetical protein